MDYKELLADWKAQIGLRQTAVGKKDMYQCGVVRGLEMAISDIEGLGEARATIEEEPDAALSESLAEFLHSRIVAVENSPLNDDEKFCEDCLIDAKSWLKRVLEAPPRVADSAVKVGAGEQHKIRARLQLAADWHASQSAQADATGYDKSSEWHDVQEAAIKRAIDALVAAPAPDSKVNVCVRRYSDECWRGGGSHSECAGYVQCHCECHDAVADSKVSPDYAKGLDAGAKAIFCDKQAHFTECLLCLLERKADSKVDVGRITRDLLRETNIALGCPFTDEPSIDEKDRWELFADALNQRLSVAAAPDSKVAEHEMNLFPHNKATGRWCLACTKSGVAQSASVRKRDIDLARDWLDHKCSEEGCGYKYNYECLAEQLLTKIRLAEREAAASAVHVTGDGEWEELRVSVEALLKWKHEHGGLRDTDGSRAQIKVVERALAELGRGAAAEKASEGER